MTFAATASMAANAQNNPLLENWNTKHQTPPFSKIKVEQYVPATREAIKEAEADINAIIKQKEKPTFENTIVAMEKAGEKLTRVSELLFNLNECCTSEEMQKSVMTLVPEITRYSNWVSMNEKLFARVKKVYDNREKLNLTTEQMVVLEDTYRGFVQNGVNLPKKDKEKFAKISEELSQLTQKFNQNVLADNNEYYLQVTNKKDLRGLPENAIAAAKEEAEQRKLEGWVFTLDYPSFGPFVTYADNRELREQMWRAYNSRGFRKNANNNDDLIRHISQLRMEKARLLGYDNYAAYALSDKMAKDVATVGKFMQDLQNSAYRQALLDVKEVKQFASDHGVEYELQRWDFSYWSEKLKKQKYSFDAELLRPYFQLDKVRQGIFDLYGTLYGVKFVEANDIEVYHPDVKVYEVYDGSRFMGVLYLDMYPRASKRSGAWMTEFRGESNLDGKEIRPLIQVVCNFTKPVGDKPSLLSFDEVETFMHEMGHAMHGMMTDVHYPSVAGTNVKHDFVETMSQVMENWCYEPQFLNTFAKHYETGDTIPADYIKKIKASENFLSGYYCIRQLNYGNIDMAYHTLQAPLTEDLESFEHRNMVELLPVVKGAISSPAFTHIFSGGYAAGYYGYKWAEVLDADIFSKFKKEGIFNKKTATDFRNMILSRGGSDDPSVLFRNFMGRDPDNTAFLIRSGFVKERQMEKTKIGR
ncbi:MAG: M3 family metallopeptidase [Bacteroidales bacterium]|nr:M3 family metallopeptidase [Bacteroidales bacterium]